MGEETCEKRERNREKMSNINAISNEIYRDYKDQIVTTDAGQYMSFGLSANPEKSMMIGGDVTVAWVDKQTLQGYAVDYFLDAKSQCSGRRGSCPDNRIQVDEWQNAFNNFTYKRHATIVRKRFDSS